MSVADSLMIMISFSTLIVTTISVVVTIVDAMLSDKDKKEKK